MINKIVKRDRWFFDVYNNLTGRASRLLSDPEWEIPTNENTRYAENLAFHLPKACYGNGGPPPGNLSDSGRNLDNNLRCKDCGKPAPFEVLFMIRKLKKEREHGT